MATKENALREQGADATDFNSNYTPATPDAAELRRTLHLTADSAINADDAITRNDADGLSKAISALVQNAGIAQSLALAWRAAQ